MAAYLFVEAMKAAGSVNDVEAIMENIQTALDNMPADKRVYEIAEVEDNGGLITELRMAVVENGEIVDKSVE